MERTNHSTVGQVLIPALQSLLGETYELSRVLVLLSDSAAYMIKMGKGLSTLLPNCVHITCLAHALHRLSESIRLRFNKVDRLVATVKTVFVKAPSRRATFQELHPETKLPPEPVITRWGTWLEAVRCHTDNYEAVREVLIQFDDADAASIVHAKELFCDSELKEQLIFIKAHFDALPDAIQKLELTSKRAQDQWCEFHKILGTVRKHEFLVDIVQAILDRNKGLGALTPALRKIEPELQSIVVKEDTSFYEKLSPAAVAALQYTLITSVDVERTFSR